MEIWIVGIMIVVAVYAFLPRRRPHSVPTARRSADTPIRRHAPQRRPTVHPFAALAYQVNYLRLQIVAAYHAWQNGWRAASAGAPRRSVSSISQPAQAAPVVPTRRPVMSRPGHQAMIQRRLEKMTRGKIQETGKESALDREIRDIMRENALAELSKRCDNALQKYAKNGKIDTDTDVYALMSIRTEAGAKRLEKIRADQDEARRFAAEAERVRQLPRDPVLERMEPVPTS